MRPGGSGSCSGPPLKGMAKNNERVAGNAHSNRGLAGFTVKKPDGTLQPDLIRKDEEKGGFPAGITLALRYFTSENTPKYQGTPHKGVPPKYALYGSGFPCFPGPTTMIYENAAINRPRITLPLRILRQGI